jgi:uroporphyrin-3 C-methyltransferase
MSSKKSDKQHKSSDISDDAGFSAVDVNATEDEFSVEPLVSKKAKTGLGMISWLALILAGLTLAVVSFNYLQNQSSTGDVTTGETQLRTLAESLAATQNSLETLEQNVASLRSNASSTSAASEQQLESIESQFNSRLRLLEAIPSKVSSLEASLASVQGITTGARDAWLLAEAEYYMQIGNAQLQLANNPQLANIALAHADNRILQLADPRLTNIRAALSDELRALEVMTKPDTAGITLALTSLAGVVDLLPLQQEVVAGAQKTAEISSDLSGVDRALASFKGAMSGVVSVRREDEATQPLIAPEAQYFLRANLTLQLQAAKLALLRGEEAIFRQSLDDVDEWLSEYYDTTNSSVQSAQQTIAEIRGSTLSVAVPDISLSLRLLRQFNSLARAPRAQPAVVRQTEADAATESNPTPSVEVEEPTE